MVTRVLDGLGLYLEGRETVATGFPSLDRLLPAGGVRRGSLVEWLASGDAGGAISLACAVACRLADPRWADQSRASQASTIVVVDRGQRFYPPAVIPWLDALADLTSKWGCRACRAGAVGVRVLWAGACGRANWTQWADLGRRKAGDLADGRGVWC